MKQLLMGINTTVVCLLALAGTAEAGKCDRVGVSVGIRVPAATGYSVLFRPTAAYARVRGYSSWNAIGNPLWRCRCWVRRVRAAERSRKLQDELQQASGDSRVGNLPDV